MNINGININLSTATAHVQEGSVNNPLAAATNAGTAQPTKQNGDRFSSSNHTVASLTDATLQTFPSRQEKVKTLRQAVSISQYQLDTERIASAIANLSI